MGVMYKLMKHKHSLDMTTVIESSTETLDNKKITAEHILQLCKFLAEKSKRNKQTVKKQKHLEYANVTHYEFEEVEEEMETEKIKEVAEAAALPLIKHNRLASISPPSPTPTTATTTATTKQVLASKIINTTSSSIQHYPPARSISPTATCSMQYHQQQGSKKDILQKIRSQIMERKRQRQLASMQHISAGGVWRPW